MECPNLSVHSLPSYLAGAVPGGQRSRRRFFLCLMSMVALPLDGLTQTASNKPIRIIVTVAPGGSDDFQGRLVAQGLTEVLGQPCIVENRAGAGGMIGREYVARAAPDGFTLLLAASSLATVPALRPSIKLDVVRDFTPISMISSGPLVLMVHPAVPAKSVRELIDLAKANPGKLSFGSSGTGQMPHLSGELFRKLTGVDFVHIPYQGITPAYADLMSGRIDFAFGVVASALPLVRAGHVRALGVANTKRSTVLPEVPTMAEAGLQGFDSPTWLALFGPAGMRTDLVARINEAVKKTLAVPEIRMRMLNAGLEPDTGTPEKLAEYLKMDVERLGKIIRDAGIKID